MKEGERLQLAFLGTAAANAYPEAFCRCANCEQARALGGPSLRKRSAALVNDDLLIDLGPDIHAAAALHARPLTNVRFCLQTHAHADHLDPSHLLSRSPAYGVVGAPWLQLYGSPATLGRLTEALARDLAPGSLFDPAAQEQLNMELRPVVPLAPFTVGLYTALAIPANHARRSSRSCTSFRQVAAESSTAPIPPRSPSRPGKRFTPIGCASTWWCSTTRTAPATPATIISAPATSRPTRRGCVTRSCSPTAGACWPPTSPTTRTRPHPELAAYAAAHGYEIAYDGLRV